MNDLTPNEVQFLRQMIPVLRRYRGKVGVIPPLTLVEGIDGQKIGIDNSVLSSSSGSLETVNSDTTDSELTTTKITANLSTGMRFDDGTPGDGFTTLGNIDASITQIGVVNLDTTTPQALGKGSKIVWGTVNARPLTTSNFPGPGPNRYFQPYSFSGTPPSAPTGGTTYVFANYWEGISGGARTGSNAYTVVTTFDTTYTTPLGYTQLCRTGTGVSWFFDLYSDPAAAIATATTNGTDDRLCMFDIFGPAKVGYSVTEMRAGTTTLLDRWVGVDRDFAAGERPRVKGGIVWGYTAPSPPAVSPSPPAGSARTLTVDGPGTVTLPDSDISASSYTASTRVLALKSDAQTKNLTLPNVSSTDSGLITAYPNNTTTFFRGDGTYAAIPSSPPGSFTTRSIVGTVTLTSKNELLKVSNSGIANTINLPAAATAGDGAWFEVADFGGTAGSANITLDGNASETINGATTFVMNTNYQGVKLVCDGSGWVAY